MDDYPVSPARKAAGARAPSRATPPHRILVVEDDEDIRLLNTDILIQHGYLVDAAEDGAVAWDAIQQKRYDLLITDNAMPRMTGMELLRTLRDARMELPVILATGNLPRAEFTRHPWLQPAAMVLKPYSIAELLEAVVGVLHATKDPSEPPGLQSGA
jgi:DNA-binding response OmpR family regulator